MPPGRDRAVIREIKEADLDAIAAIEAAVFTRPLTRDDLVSLYRKPAFRGFLLAPDGGPPASYALFLTAGGAALLAGGQLGNSVRQVGRNVKNGDRKDALKGTKNVTKDGKNLNDAMREQKENVNKSKSKK